MTRITPCLWFDGQAEEAANFYLTVFPNSRIGSVSRYGEAAAKASGRAVGDVMVVTFELDGRPMMGLNGGPMFKFSEAISLKVDCETQQEIDWYWDNLSRGGTPGRCGWLKDQFGLSWQIVPAMLGQIMGGGSPESTNRVMAALLQMGKLDIASLRRAQEQVQNTRPLTKGSIAISNHTAPIRDLVLTRVIDAPPEKLFRAWADPLMLKQWFAPLPFTAPVVELDVRPGGASLVAMRGPDGAEMPCRGVHLEVVPNQRLVFTDAFSAAREPSEKAFMTVILTFEDLGGRTKYTAQVRHWTEVDRETHENMGFYQGWGQCADQLTKLVTTGAVS
ncbi:MAG: hypothetical protein EXR07_02175 [Acetobacteraceae bacterium]|nr:hypothetical protein [Acetobacteraceae bacterium]